jgi:hypothetical protein
MTKNQLRMTLGKTLPYLRTFKERLALFCAILLLAVGTIESGSGHTHVDANPDEVTVVSPLSASGNSTAKMLSYTSIPFKPKF